MTEHVWTVDYQIFPDDIGPLGVPTGACFAYRNGEEIDCVEIERRLNEYETLKAATERLSAEDAMPSFDGIMESLPEEDKELVDGYTLSTIIHLIRKRNRAYADTLEGK